MDAVRTKVTRRAASVDALGNARVTWRMREGALLCIEDDAGRVGIGECSPLPGYSRESIDDCVQALNAFDGSLDALAGVSPPAARFAAECALLDLRGQREGESIAALFGASRGTEVPVSAVIDASAPFEEWVRRVRAHLARGIRTVKVKIGREGVPFERELDALKRMRDEAGAPFALRLDANGAWSRDDARRHLARLAVVEPEFVEEPVAGLELLTLGACAAPWAADESLCDSRFADAIFDAPGCGAIVLKPALLGGLARCRELAARASMRGMGVVVTHLFDGPIALAAACELACSLGSARACGLDVHGGLAVWPRVEIPQLARAGVVISSSHPGVGLTSSDRRLLHG